MPAGIVLVVLENLKLVVQKTRMPGAIADPHPCLIPSKLVALENLKLVVLKY
jgi:hypothetical protein